MFFLNLIKWERNKQQKLSFFNFNHKRFKSGVTCKKISKVKLHKSFLSPPAASLLRSSLDSPSSSPIVGSPSLKISKPLLRKIKTCDQLSSLPITPETTPETKSKDLV